ncbi:uncharacterized protein LOC134323150 isoform X3 [Trichomycterus rosablanca]|uniref:uncharacterized protein LOC134323150 isoform X3 n=1 Tax=Trichomycterus rosablanca TaxID=2290929 RepID=UPI002F3560C5
MCTLRLAFLAEPHEEVLIPRSDASIKKVSMPYAMSERDFQQKVRDTFPDLQDGDFELCRVDRRRKIHTVDLSSQCPSVIKACPEFSRSAIYIRSKERAPEEFLENNEDVASASEPSPLDINEHDLSTNPELASMEPTDNDLLAWRALRAQQDDEFQQCLQLDREKEMRRRQFQEWERR